LTTIAAIQGEGWAVIGYDSRVTEDNRIFVLPKDSGKVVKNGHYIFGAAGDMRAVNLLAHTFKPPVPTTTDYMPAPPVTEGTNDPNANVIYTPETSPRTDNYQKT
jgi:hypothetical protein